mgnify:CR=1 FL=1
MMTTGRCRVGDLAITVNTDLPENAGTVVEVLAVRVHDRAWGDRHGPLCLVRAAGSRPLQFNVMIDGKARRHIARLGVVPDSRLMPITPPPQELVARRDRGVEAS